MTAVLLGWILLGAPAQAASVAIERFSRIGPLSDGVESIRRVELPFEVLMGSTRADLSDVHVFDGSGRLVPSNTYYLRSRGETLTSNAALQFFPFGAQADRDAIRYSFQIDRDNLDTRINLSTAGAARAPGKTNYVVHIPSHVRHQHGALSQLALVWMQPDENLIVPMRVEGSADLQSWRVLVERAVISDLEHEGVALVTNTIKLPAFKGSYLRLSWPGSAAQFELQTITGEFFRDRITPAQLRSQRVACAASTADVCQFEIAPQLSVETFSLLTDRTRYFLQGGLYAAGRRDGDWIRRAKFQQYRLTVDGQVIENAGLRWPDAAARRWQLRVDPPGADAHVGSIEIQWYPVYQAFLAQGQGPYRLAYGNPDAFNPGRAAMDTLLGRAGKRIDDVETVNLGDLRAIDLTTGYWNRQRIEVVALWAVLLLGVAVLFRLAWNLLRKMNAAAAAPEEEASAAPPRD